MSAATSEPYALAELDGRVVVLDMAQSDVEAGRLAVVVCRWFVGCVDEATDLRPHPILGPVPACARHLEDPK